MSNITKIWIDVGHGGNDPGAVSGSLIERDINKVYAQAIADYLKQYNVDIRVEEGNLLIVDSAEKANTWQADFIISCHVNAGAGDRGEVFYAKEDGSLRLANAIAKGLKAADQSIVNVVYKPNSSNTAEYFSILRNSKMPGVLIEPCFIDNTNDNKIISTIEKQKELGRCIAEAIVLEYGFTLVNDPKSEEEDMDSVKFKELWLEMRKEFQDNDNSAYSAQAREWAIKTGLVVGSSSEEPNYMWEDILTREQLITVLYRFANLIGKV